MDASGADDGTDFRPFFDMVIGILFVLLILVAAQIYFQQAQDQTTASEAAKREAALRRADIAAFLDALAGRLRADGLDATADHEAGAVVMPLRDVLAVGPAGLPTVRVEAAGRLGADLSALTGCVTLPRSTAPACSDFARLDADRLAVTTRVGSLPTGTALPRDRFGDLADALLSAEMLSGDPALLAASGPTGGRVIAFASEVVAGDPAAPDLGGDLALDFTFR